MPRELVEAGFPPTHLSIEGFAQYRSKVHNDSPQARATNRGIKIVCQRGSVRKHMVDVLQRNIDRSLRIYSPGIL